MIIRRISSADRLTNGTELRAAADFEGPGAITYGGNGTLYVADNVDIRKIVVATAAVTTFAGGVKMPGYVDRSLADARFDAPSALSFDGAGHVYVADYYVVRRIDLAAGTVSTPVGVVGSMGVRLGHLPGSEAFTRALVAVAGGVAIGGERARYSWYADSEARSPIRQRVSV